MNYERYEPLLISGDALEFKFNSIGPKGEISIVVQFAETDDPGIYNLAFGNLLPDGCIDDHVKNDNRDRNKILATVAAAIYEFSFRRPEKLIFFTGSTSARTRLYRMAITNNLIELSIDFEIYGVNLINNTFWAETFEKAKEYYGFVIKRKNN
ncbi:hypothetical protein HB364_27590 [Pseudoflavitalea sp. X16]|uniref:DUF6934 family protein n=1 Tax=Paraflavitalea devenefica TaxID=2716334 RepID=UPI001422E91B|nr:hypothetical protein [Paraflavitalea devenefica]NII28872.1 hypothetical protein [Paraflavitalea devenefica]